jgi:hypothetical protein
MYVYIHFYLVTVSQFIEMRNVQTNCFSSRIILQSVNNASVILSVDFIWCSAQSWFRHCFTSRNVAGSISSEAIDLFHLPNPSNRTMAPGLTSASNRNEYEESSCVLKSGRRVSMTTFQPSVSPLYKNVVSLTFHNTIGIHGLLQG